MLFFAITSTKRRAAIVNLTTLFRRIPLTRNTVLQILISCTLKSSPNSRVLTPDGQYPSCQQVDPMLNVDARVLYVLFRENPAENHYISGEPLAPWVPASELGD